MTVWLKQSTAINIRMGPFVDSGDGVTAETSLTISQADVRLSKAQGSFAQKNDSTSATHLENGWYSVPLNTTDTNTLGELVVAINESGALPVWREFMVVPANVWDSYFSSDKLEVDLTQWRGTQPNTLTSNRVDVTVGAMAANVVTASALAADAVSEIGDEVNAEVLDVLNTDTFAQPGQENPAATTTLVNMIRYLYKAWRNRHTVTDTEYALYADDGTTKDQEATISDDGTTFERGEISTGA